MKFSVRFVVPRFAPNIGGVETRVEEIATRLSGKGLAVEVCAFDKNEVTKHYPVTGGFQVRRFRAIAPNDAYYLPSLSFCGWARRHPVDILDIQNIHALPAFVAGLSRSKSERVCVTPHYHGQGHTQLRKILFRGFKNLAKLVVERCDSIVCVSETEKSLVEHDFAQAKRKIVVIPNGVNYVELDRYPWNGTSRQKSLLYVGRLEKYKNVDALIRAARILRERYEDTFRVTIIGSGPHEAALRVLCIDAGLGDLVDWMPRVTREQLLQRYQSASLFVTLSEHEAYSLTVADAIALGLPTLVPKVGVFANYVNRGLAHGVDSPISAEQVAEKLHQILQDPISYCRREESKRCFLSWDEVATETLSTYTSLSR